MTYKPDKERFLTRWSRRKQEARKEEPREEQDKTALAAQGPAAEKPQDAQSPPAELPPLEQLDYDSDYRAFLNPRVDENTRRAALKKLFADARFNVIDGLDVYIDDYTKSESIPAEMLASLRQAQKILDWARGDDKSAAGDGTGPAKEPAAKKEALPDDHERGSPPDGDLTARSATNEPEMSGGAETNASAMGGSRRDS